MRWIAGFATAAVSLASVTAGAQATPKVVNIQLETSSGGYGGRIWLVQEKNDVKVIVKLKNLDPGNHGIHIHQMPHCDAPTFMTAGPHFNPSGKQHGFQNANGHHAGDLPINLAVNDGGIVTKTFTTKDITLDPKAPNSVFANGGTSIIVHKNADDMKTDPSGNSGAREACGIIDIKNTASKVEGTAEQGESIPSSNH